MLAAHSAEPGVANSVLVIAGGYDKRLAENRDYFDEIRDLVSECGLESKVASLILRVIDCLAIVRMQIASRDCRH